MDSCFEIINYVIISVRIVVIMYTIDQVNYTNECNFDSQPTAKFIHAIKLCENVMHRIMSHYVSNHVAVGLQSSCDMRYARVVSCM